MRLSILAVGSFCIALGLGVGAGCDDDDDTIDEGIATGGTVGTGGTGGAGGAGGSTGGAGGAGGSTGGAGGAGGSTGGAGGAGGSTGGAGGAGGGTVTYVQVQPLFVAKCTPCHAGGGIGASAHRLVDSNADAKLPAAHPECMGMTKGECTLIRVKDGDMPLGRGCSGNPAQDASNSACLTQQEQDLLAAWITGGLM